ncbi:MAG: Holliday junction branch migration protein RuvA [Pikeienuella sp.]|uniref:Holliday junction branch migration protein RuvA n=1 Tax=Pikeienuella sp. TaxID=2831957 RepID=UPI00391AE810
MIGKVSGRVDHVAEDHALIEAGGVGYEVHAPPRVLAGLRPGMEAALYTVHIVREDAQQLFGYPTREERDWHRLLASVQGVGAKVALGILGALGAEGAARAVALGDAAAMKAAPGVGPKLAQRIVLELKGKAPAGAAPLPLPRAAAPKGERSAREDALSALANLGYQPSEASAAVLAAEEAGAEGAPALIRAALKSLAPGR